MYCIASKFNSLWLLLPVVVLAITAVNVLFYPDGFRGHRGSGGWNIVSNGLYFVFGYLIFANTRIMDYIKNLRWVFLGAGLVASACLFTFLVDQLADPITNIGTVKYVAAYLVQALNTWAWLLAIVGLASRYLSHNNKFVNYSNQAVLPFYVLHQTVIIVIGFYVVQWSTSIGLKYLIISLTSFTAIMAIYELIVRRLNIFRFLLGMKATKVKSLQAST